MRKCNGLGFCYTEAFLKNFTFATLLFGVVGLTLTSFCGSILLKKFVARDRERLASNLRALIFFWRKEGMGSA